MFSLRLFLPLVFALATAMADQPPSREIVEFKARAGLMTATAISKDGKLVLTGEDDGLVTLWSMATGASVHNYMGHARGVFAAALLPDGKRAVTCGDDNMVIVWELATGKRLHEMTTGDSIPYVMSCAADGSLAATGGSDGAIDIWQLDTGKRLTALRRRSSLCGIHFSPNGRLLAAGYSDGQTILWSTADWAPAITIPADHGASAGALAFSPDGGTLVTGNQNGNAAAWNVADGKKIVDFIDASQPAPSPPNADPLPVGPLTAPDHGAVAFVCAGGNYTLTAGQNTVPKMWETKTGKLVKTMPWLSDARFYVARYGFPFATASVSPQCDKLVTTKENLAQVWSIDFAPNP